MNFFKKKKKVFISIDSSDLKTSPEDLLKLFFELNEEISTEENLVIKFSELQDLTFPVLSMVISFIMLVENSHTIAISIQAEAELLKKFKEANFGPIVSKLMPT